MRAAAAVPAVQTDLPSGVSSPSAADLAELRPTVREVVSLFPRCAACGLWLTNWSEELIELVPDRARVRHRSCVDAPAPAPQSPRPRVRPRAEETT